MAAGVGQIRAGGAIFEVGLGGPIDRQLRGLQRRLRGIGRFADGFDKIGRGFQSLGTKALGLSTAMAAPFIGAIKAASDMQETMGKFNIVFGEAGPAVEKFATQLGKGIGRSQLQIRGFLAEAQDLFVPLGFDAGRAAELSKQITELTFDLGSFNNKADPDVFRDLSAALTGSGEVMKKYGVIVSEAAVKQEILRQGLDPKNATNMQKVMARLNIIMAGTTAAQGDAERTAGGFANQMKALQASIMDNAVLIGEALLPAVTELIQHVNSRIVPAVTKWIQGNQGTIVSIAKLVPMIAAGGAGFIALGSVITTAAATLTALVTAGTAAVGIAGLLATKLGLAAAGATAFIATGPEFQNAVATNFQGAKSTALEAINGIILAIKSGEIENAFKLVTVAVKAEFELLKLAIDDIGLAIVEDFNKRILSIPGITATNTAIGAGAQQRLTETGILRGVNETKRGLAETAVSREVERQKLERTARAAEELVRLLSSNNVALPVIP